MNFKDKIKMGVQDFAHAMLQPVFFLVIPGLLIALCSILQLNIMPGFIKSAGNFIFTTFLLGNIAQLSVIFCVGLSAGLAKKNKGQAAVVGILSFLIFITANNLWLKGHDMLATADPQFGLSGTGQAMVLGVQSLDMGVFSGILLGCITGYIFNKYSEVDFPVSLSIYGGPRFAYLIVAAIDIFLAIVLSYVWPVVNNGINSITNIMSNTGIFGLYIYGFLNRFLIPTGLHHLVYMPFMYTSIGGTAKIAGEVVQGADPIWFAQMGIAHNLTSINEAARYMNWGFSKIFGCIGIALAFIKTAKPENKARTKAFIIPTLLTAVLSGITEPFEFAFLFISPLLWLIHSLLDGLFQILIYLSGARVCFTGGIIDLVTKNIVMPIGLTKLWIVPIIGVIGTATWYFLFVYFIKKLDLQTPGREDTPELKSDGTNADYGAIAQDGNDPMYIVEGLGGEENIDSLDSCFTRLRINVKDPSLINKDIINKYPNSGIVHKEGHKHIQVVIGMNVAKVKDQILSKIHID